MPSSRQKRKPIPPPPLPRGSYASTSAPLHSADGKQKSTSDPSSSSSFGPLSSSYLPALLCTLFVINLLNKIFGKKKKNLVVEEVGTWKQRSDR